MSAPHVKILLEDGTNTWVTTVPVGRSLPPHIGVVTAAGEAMALFIASLVRDADLLDERLDRFARFGEDYVAPTAVGVEE